MPVTSEEPDRLSRMQTLWTLVCKAHQGTDESGREARTALLERYGGAVRRYLLGAVRDADAADDLAQEFAVKFLRGDFRNADPEQGRFRSFLKTALFRLVVDFQRPPQAATPPHEFVHPGARGERQPAFRFRCGIPAKLAQ